MSVDPMRGRTNGFNHPARSAFAIVPDDANDTTWTRGVYVGVSGDVHALMVDGSEITFVGLAAGIIHPMRVRRVYATGTTATSIVGVF